jgi:uncharacterized membrane protein YoaK (UPF0700 family)
MDIATASSIHRDETVPIALLLAFAGGYLDAYTWIVYGVMANAQTANLVLLWVYGSIGDWTKALHFVPPILAFAVGVVVAAWLRRATGDRASAISTLIEVVLLVAIGILHNRLPDLAGTLGISFVAAIAGDGSLRRCGIFTVLCVTFGLGAFATKQIANLALGIPVIILLIVLLGCDAPRNEARI